MSKEYKHWNTEKKLIPVMIRMYCRGNHKEERKAEGVKGRETRHRGYAQPRIFRGIRNAQSYDFRRLGKGRQRYKNARAQNERG